jgi:hypothetical protein
MESCSNVDAAKKTNCTHCGKSMYLITTDVQFAVTVDSASTPAAISIVPCVAIPKSLIDEHRTRLGSGLHENSDDCIGIMMAPVLINQYKKDIEELSPPVNIVSAIVDTPIVRIPPKITPPSNPKPLW